MTQASESVQPAVHFQCHCWVILKPQANGFSSWSKNRNCRMAQSYGRAQHRAWGSANTTGGHPTPFPQHWLEYRWRFPSCCRCSTCAPLESESLHILQIKCLCPQALAATGREPPYCLAAFPPSSLQTPWRFTTGDLLHSMLNMPCWNLHWFWFSRC